MNKRPRAESNGKGDVNSNGNGKVDLSYLNSKSLLRTQVSRRPSSRPPIRKPVPALQPLLVLCGLAIVGIILAMSTQQPLVLPPSPSPVSQADSFRLGVNRAMAAAEATQLASSKAEWQTIAIWWEEAVNLMQNVSPANANAAVARNRVVSYQRNLAYARERMEQAAVSPVSKALWTRGVRRADVLRIQGNPTQTERYDGLCKEVLYYGRSTVELSNGFVVRYDDADRNLRASLSEQPLVMTNNTTTWTLDSPKVDLFRIQGTPTRIIRYDASQRDMLYYGDSLVYVTGDRVVGYDNLSKNLRVTVVPNDNNPVKDWSVDSPRDDVFKVQGTPSHVSLDAGSCSETLQYGNSSIELRNGYVAGYDDVDRNLRVRVK